MSRRSFARVPMSSHQQRPGTCWSHGPGRSCVFWPPWITVQNMGFYRDKLHYIFFFFFLAVMSLIFHMKGDTHGKRARKKKLRCKWGLGDWTMNGGVGMRNICPGNQTHINYCPVVNDVPCLSQRYLSTSHTPRMTQEEGTSVEELPAGWPMMMMMMMSLSYFLTASWRRWTQPTVGGVTLR